MSAPSIFIRLHIIEDGQDLVYSRNVSQNMLSRAYDLSFEKSETAEKKDFSLLKEIYGKIDYEKIQKAIKESYVKKPTLDQFAQAHWELIGNPTLEESMTDPIAQLRINAAKHKKKLAAGWDTKTYGDLSGELNKKVDFGKYPDIRTLNNLKK